MSYKESFLNIDILKLKEHCLFIFLFSAFFILLMMARLAYLATVVMVEEPSKAYYCSGLVATPIYKNAISKALFVLKIPANDPLLDG